MIAVNKCELHIFICVIVALQLFILRIQIGRQTLAKSTGSDNPFLHRCATRRAVALRRRIFKPKKGFANLSLGLIYHSKALSQPPSRDTVPLSRL
jgi:hypothetical protein